jgi:hypothetical protein
MARTSATTLTGEETAMHNPFSKGAKEQRANDRDRRQRQRAADRAARESQRAHERAARDDYTRTLEGIDPTDPDTDVSAALQLARGNSPSHLTSNGRRSAEREMADRWLQALLGDRPVTRERIWQADEVIQLFEVKVDEDLYALLVAAQLDAGLWPAPRHEPSLLARGDEVVLFVEPTVWILPDAYTDEGQEWRCQLEISTDQIAVLGHPDGDFFLPIRDVRTATADGKVLRVVASDRLELVLRTKLAAVARDVLAAAVRHGG